MTKILNSIREFVKPKYEKLKCWVHKWHHVERVAYYSGILAELENADKESCIIAAYCHDLGRIEEEKLKTEKGSSSPHPLLSIEPTIKILQENGISGVKFSEIIEAIIVHSYKIYDGNNKVAQILQDADKMAGLGFHGILDAVKYFGGKDYIDSKKIRDNQKDSRKLKEFCGEIFRKIEKDVLEKTLRGLKFKSEWFDMLHTESAKKIIRKDYEDFEWARNKLINLEQSSF
ncbi:hypothetical protein CMI39_00880 [Candidatus Pacearchaeota archaeon]|jgi:HD superfamily phosphodiesterase|nr:hypothetical protein [Candidatus Pacearchaeota archaeon]|tara:strand:- start:18052 stop:18744 length:693 start_codon:yes stop_codon:yes gene_type:complete